MEEDKVKQIVAEAIGPKFKDMFTRGCVAGWEAAWLTMYKQIGGMTSAKQIKEFVKSKTKETHINVEQA